MTICYQGLDPVVGTLNALNSKDVKGKVLKVIETTPSNATDCQALYISPRNAAILAKTLAQIGASPVLVAADSPNYFSDESFSILICIQHKNPAFN